MDSKLSTVCELHQTFITGLYSGELSRAPDVSGVAFIQQELSQHTSRATGALQVAKSPEAQILLVGQIQEASLPKA